LSGEKGFHDAQYFIDLAQRCEVEADSALSDSDKASLYRDAASAHHELGCYGDEARCLRRGAEFVKGSERIDCLVSAWGAYMGALTSYRYESSFEWKGEVENLDPNYSDMLDKYYSGAVDALAAALMVPDVDREKLLERLYSECVRRRNDGGWGEQECFESLNESFRGKRRTEK
jgi:hypothetical protein